MPDIQAKYEKDKLPETLKGYAVEKDGFMVVQFDESVQLATNPALATKNAELLSEKQKIQTKYDALVTSSATLAQTVTDLQAKIASGGQVSADELKILTAIKTLGDNAGTPADIKKALEEVPALRAQVAQFATNEENAKIAEVMGWKPQIFGDLRNLPSGKDLKFELAKTEVDGKEKSVVYVVTKDANNVETKKDLNEFVKSNDSWKNFLPSLQLEQKSGPTWLEQAPANGNPPSGTSALDAHIAKRNQVAEQMNGVNPLIPQKPPMPVQVPAPAA